MGSKVERFTVAADEMDDGDGEFSGGVKGRRTQGRPRQDKNQMIKQRKHSGRANVEGQERIISDVLDTIMALGNGFYYSNMEIHRALYL
jgi:hypothetical protein